MKMGTEQIQKYLKRINYTEPILNNGETLEKLQYAHLKNIPYENLDILNHIPLSLELPNLFNKIIERNRGGYCFELNSVYCWLLESIGFKVESLLGRFIIGETDIQMRCHRILKVEATDGIYLCDVGVRSESPRVALKLIQNEIQSDGFSEYKFIKEKFWGLVLWQKEEGKNWVRMYAFTEEPQLDIDYHMPSFYCEQHPDSDFNKYMKLSIFTESGRVSLVGSTLKIYSGIDNVRRITLEGKEEIEIEIKKYFGIGKNHFEKNHLGGPE